VGSKKTSKKKSEGGEDMMWEGHVAGNITRGKSVSLRRTGLNGSKRNLEGVCSLRKENRGGGRGRALDWWHVKTVGQKKGRNKKASKIWGGGNGEKRTRRVKPCGARSLHRQPQDR